MMSKIFLRTLQSVIALLTRFMRKRSTEKEEKVRGKRIDGRIV